VVADDSQIDAMKAYSGGSRRVPVIVEGDDVSIGFNGRS